MGKMNQTLFSHNENSTFHIFGNVNILNIQINYNHFPEYHSSFTRKEQLLQKIRQSPNNLICYQKLEKTVQELIDFEKSVKNLYKELYNIPLNTTRQRTVKQAFDKGDLAEVRRLLDAKELEAEQELWLAEKADFEQKLIANAEDWVLKAWATATDFSLKEQRLLAVCECFENALKSHDDAEIHFEYAYFLQDNNQFLAAKPHYKRALKQYRELAEQQPKKYLPNVANTLNNLAGLLAKNKNYTYAQTLFEEALAIYQDFALYSLTKFQPKVEMVQRNLALLEKEKSQATSFHAA